MVRLRIMGRTAIFISGPPGAGKSAVAEELSKLLGCPLVEVDEFKVKRRGTTEKSGPEDFADAGDRAATELGKNDQVIVVEAFGPEAPFVELVAKRLPPSAKVRHFYLWCDPDVAVERKKGTLAASVVRRQFERFPGQTYPGRTSVDTTESSVQDVAAHIASALQLPADS